MFLVSLIVVGDSLTILEKVTAMKTTLVVREKGVPKNSALAKSEHELYEAMSGAYESFYSQGVILNRINVEKEYKDAGFESFAEYMNERQPCGIQRAQAYRLIQAMQIRPLLPVVSDSETGSWSEWSIRPLLHKDFSPADQKRLGNKIAKRVKNGEKLTASLVKEVCDDDRGVERKAAEKQQQEVAETPTPFEIIKQCRVALRGWIKSLGSVPGEFWVDAETETPGCRKELSETASELASVLADIKSARKDVQHARRN